MFKATRDLVLPTTVTGSLPRPAWFDVNLSGRTFSVAMADIVFREQYCDAVAVAISDQQRAGLDILVDGDSRFDTDVAGRAWFGYVGERIRGLTPGQLKSQPLVSNRDKQPGDILFEVVETRLPQTVVARVSGGPLEYDRLWKVAQRCTHKPVKLGGISAQLFEGVLSNEFYRDRRELVMDLSVALNTEYHLLADAGCPVIQIEEPAIHETVGIVEDRVMTPAFYVEALNREVAGLRDKTEVWCHTCWGSPAAQRVEHERHGYAASLPYLNQLDVDVLTFETADDGGRDLEIIGKGVSKDKKVCIGVVSHRTLEVERPERVAALIQRALKYVEPERLVISTDCGFGRQGMSRMHAFYKMVAIVRGTNLVRRELGLNEVEVPAADPRYALLLKS
jgi:5-methyltetrahydropteroyltriglutamate--homocysteine methyltransferase